MGNTFLEFKCPCCDIEVTEDDLIAEHDLWTAHSMEELDEEDQAQVVRENAICPECETGLEEQ